MWKEIQAPNWKKALWSHKSQVKLGKTSHSTAGKEKSEYMYKGWQAACLQPLVFEQGTFCL